MSSYNWGALVVEKIRSLTSHETCLYSLHIGTVHLCSGLRSWSTVVRMLREQRSQSCLRCMSPSTRHTMRLLHSETVLTRKENAAKLLVSTKNCRRSPCEDALQDRELDGVPLWIEWSKSHVPQARMLQDFKWVLLCFFSRNSSHCEVQLKAKTIVRHDSILVRVFKLRLEHKARTGLKVTHDGSRSWQQCWKCLYNTDDRLTLHDYTWLYPGRKVASCGCRNPGRCQKETNHWQTCKAPFVSVLFLVFFAASGWSSCQCNKALHKMNSQDL